MPRKIGKKKTALSRNRPNKAKTKAMDFDQLSENESVDEPLAHTSPGGGTAGTGSDDTNNTNNSSNSPGPSCSTATTRAKSGGQHKTSVLKRDSVASILELNSSIDDEDLFVQIPRNKKVKAAPKAKGAPKGKQKPNVGRKLSKQSESQSDMDVGHESELESEVSQTAAKKRVEKPQKALTMEEKFEWALTFFEYPKLVEEAEEKWNTILEELEEDEDLDSDSDILDLVREVRTEILGRKSKYLMALNKERSQFQLAMKILDAKILLKMSYEDMLAIIKKGQGIETEEVETFEDLLLLMKNARGKEIARGLGIQYKVNMDESVDVFEPVENKRNEDRRDGNEDSDLFSDDDDEGPQTPKFLPESNKPVVAKVGSNARKLACVFPSSSEMLRVGVTTANQSTPTVNSVFRFGTNVGMSTNKAARPIKPGEVMFSESGSPLILPKTAGGLMYHQAVSERIPVSDEDGKKIIEVILVKTDEATQGQYKDFVTDIRGLVATKSIRKQRILPPRLPKANGPQSASKKPLWH